MSKPFLISFATATALSLGGCQTVFDSVGVAVPLSAGASHRFDGSYQGNVDLVSSTGPACPHSEGERVMMVGDGVLWYAYSPTVLFTLPVNWDGSISGTTGDTVLQGGIKGDRLNLTVKSPSCLTAISMSYVYNHS